MIYYIRGGQYVYPFEEWKSGMTSDEMIKASKRAMHINESPLAGVDLTDKTVAKILDYVDGNDHVVVQLLEEAKAT